jgi:hypothetical protein
MSTVDAEFGAINGWLPGLRPIKRMAFLAVALLASFGPAASADDGDYEDYEVRSAGTPTRRPRSATSSKAISPTHLRQATAQDIRVGVACIALAQPRV